MADYQRYPLWDMHPGVYRDIAPSELPISRDLQEDLLKWAAVYNSTVNLDSPLDSGFKSEDAERAFKREGERLAERLRLALGSDYSILFKG
jgi:hypothetical protein